MPSVIRIIYQFVSVEESAKSVAILKGKFELSGLDGPLTYPLLDKLHCCA
jgi:hypothetical protein